MKKTLGTALFCALVVSSVACGGDDGGSSDAGVDAAVQSAALDPVCNATDGLFVVLFARAFECNPFFELILGTITSADLSGVCYASFQPFLDDGTIAVSTDAPNIAACRAYLATDCAAYDIDVIPCDDVIVGQIAAGNDCDISEQCVPGTYCDTSGAGCGSCAAKLAAGVPCDESDDCTAGYCNAVGNCAAKGAIGDACTANEDCLGQLPCDTATNLCAAIATFAVDDPCDSADFVACGFPFSGLLCASSNLCVAEVDIGLACDGGDARCHTLEFEWCNNGICAGPAAAAESAACGIGITTQASECNPGLVCTDLFNGGTCVSPQEEGESCVDSEGVDLDNECAFFLTCIAGTCAATEYSGMCPAP